MRSCRAGDAVSARETKELRLALLGLFLDVETVAVCSYEECTYPGGVFDDRKWRASDPREFAVATRARRALGLKPFQHRDARKFGRADDRLFAFRKKERAMLAGKP